MSTKPIEQKVFVLHSRPFQENQLLIELLTEHKGKISALVYVGQSKRSIKKGMMQPFLPLKLTFKDNNTSLKRITHVETTAPSYVLSKDNLYSGFYINELLVRLINEDIVCEALFNQYQLTLSALSENLPIAPQLRQFELCLLAELGLSFDFSPVFNENSDNVAGFYYVAEQGFVPAYQYAITTINTPWFNTEHLQVIAEHIHHDKVLLHKDAAQTFKLLMRLVINHLLDGKPLNSRKLFTKKQIESRDKYVSNSGNKTTDKIREKHERDFIRR
ncbi:MAG: DNA repair protein RecO [Colwellia sp.]|nr:DNA repair protein RecO [Colwellia sp.]